MTTTIPFTATHPGVLIRDELDVRPELRQKDLAKELGVKASFINEIIKGKRPVTADIAILLEKVLGISADYWMKFQSQFEIDKARIKEKNIVRIKNIELWGIIKEYVPIKYLKKWGYLNDELNNDIDRIKTIYSVTSIDELVSSFAKNKFTFYRKSEKLKIDEKNMFAWSSLAIYEAERQKTNTFNFANIDQLCLDLNLIIYENSNTVNKVKELLNQYGIKLILIQKLDKPPIDGFSFWSGNNPAIALTLRHNRIDNFAFTLMHEIAHIDIHLRNNKDQKFLDLINKEHPDIHEKEADLFAQERLISKECWQDMIENQLPINDDEIIEVGNKYGINPAIILGRVCYETNDYALKTRIDKKLK